MDIQTRKSKTLGQLLKIKNWPYSVSTYLYFRVCVAMNILFDPDKQMKNESLSLSYTWL
jgi:hypothetical protein